MTNVHAKIHLVKEEESKNLKYVGSDKANPFDPTKPVAEAITKDTWLLCFDEFQVIITIILCYYTNENSNNNKNKLYILMVCFI